MQHLMSTKTARILPLQSIMLSWGYCCISSLLQPMLTGDKLLALRPYGQMEGLHTWSTELTHRGRSALVMDTAETATFWRTPGHCGGPAVSLLGCVVDLHVRSALSQVFAVMAQTVLGNLDGIEVTLRAPLSWQRHACMERRETEQENVKLSRKASLNRFLYVFIL